MHQRSLRLAAYALPSLLSSVAALPVVLFVPAFYADDLGVPLAAVGAAIAASRLLDVVTDPLIGIASDRLGLRWGRRKPWIVLGTPLFAVALWQLFVPGAQASAGSLLVWSALLYVGFTLIDLPHKAWGAELSSDYDERTRITSWREGLSAAGQVALLAALGVWGSRGVDDASEQLRGIASVVVVALPVLVAVAVLSVPEGPRVGFAHPPLGLGAGLRLVARNPAFRRMIGCVVLFVSGIAIQGTLHRLVLADVMADEQRFPLMLLLENLATLAAVPLWLRISLATSKHRALAAAALWLALFSVPLVFLRQGDTTTLMVLVAIRGSSFASILFLANSIAADVIDLDTLESGEQRSGLYFAVWGMVTKLSLALGVLMGTAIPAAFGYDPATAGVGPAVQGRLMAIYGGLPALLMGAGALFLRGFPVTRQRHAIVREQIARRATWGSSERPGRPRAGVAWEEVRRTGPPSSTFLLHLRIRAVDETGVGQGFLGACAGPRDAEGGRMLRSTVWCATVLAGVALVYDVLAVPAEHTSPARSTAALAALGPGGTAEGTAEVAGRLPAVGAAPRESGAKPLHPVLIRHPETLGVLDTELHDVRGTPVGIDCATCHTAGLGSALADRPGVPEDFHAGVDLEHGALSCDSCHHPDDRTLLRLADGTRLAVAEVMKLCGQCHGPQLRDYVRGSHGGMTGYWDRTRGPQVRNSCVACHAAHEPAYPVVIPAAPPRDRFLPQHPAPRPASRLPGREGHGATRHD